MQKTAQTAPIKKNIENLPQAPIIKKEEKYMSD
jgi:hypothetical protein